MFVLIVFRFFYVLIVKYIEQGRLGDCWFLSAVAVLTEVSRISEVIITPDYNEEGIYTVRFCVQVKIVGLFTRFKSVSFYLSLFLSVTINNVFPINCNCYDVLKPKIVINWLLICLFYILREVINVSGKILLIRMLTLKMVMKVEKLFLFFGLAVCLNKLFVREAGFS